MKYNCRKCKYKWEGNIDTFYTILDHEKTHLNIDKIISTEVTA